MSSKSAFDYATPYDIMVGLWTVQKITYNQKGEYLDSTSSFVAVYWHIPDKLIHFREDQADDTSSSKRFIHKAPVAKVLRLELDLKVTGKLAQGKNLTAAAKAAKAYVESALKSAPVLGHGIGPVV